MSKALLEHLQKNHGLKADATEADARTEGRKLVKAGTITIAQYGDLCAGKAFSPPTPSPAPTADELLDRAEKEAQRLNPRPESGVTAVDVFASLPEANGSKAGKVDVVRASARYDKSHKRLSWPGDEKARLHLGTKAGQDICLPDGSPAYQASQCDKAMRGAWFKYKLACAARQDRRPFDVLNDHEKDLVNELVHEGLWVGSYTNPGAPGGESEIAEPCKLASLRGGLIQKTYLEDSTSGGTFLVPYVFDLDLVTYPLLYGQLFPLVDLRELPISNQVKTPTLANLTTNAGPAEGDSPGISLQSTSGLSTVLTSSVYNFTGAITIGRDMLSDTPIALQEEFFKLFDVSQLQFLEKGIAIGDGSTYILGIFNTSGTATWSAINGTVGPYQVKDIEGMYFSLPLQYRNQGKLAWVSADSGYKRIRSIAVSATDQRRIFGYDYAKYMLFDETYRVENDVSSGNVAFGRVDKYRLWRRKGLELQATTDGKTLMLANEALIVARSRWAGQVIDPNAWVICTNGAQQ